MDMDKTKSTTADQESQKYIALSFNRSNGFYSDHEDASYRVVQIIAEQTGYASSDIELYYELEADLGIDTVKQAEIFSTLQEQFGIGETDTQLSEVQTIAALIEWVKTNADDDSAANAPAPSPLIPSESPTETASTNAPQTPLVTQNQTASNATGIDPSQQVITIIAEQTGYTTDDIELDYELEADLGIDTVKQAEIFSMLQEQFGIGETDTQLSEVQTIAALIEWVKTNADDKSESALTSTTGKQDTPAAPARSIHNGNSNRGHRRIDCGR